MARITHMPDFSKVLLDKVTKDADDFMSEWLGYAAGLVPLESELGLEHTVEALMTAVRQVGGDEAQAVLAAHGHKASGDPTAQQAVSVTKETTDTSAVISVTIDLPFMAVMDQGGTLRPISPGGLKAGDSEGALYASRTSVGRGMLMWYDPSNPRASLHQEGCMHHQGLTQVYTLLNKLQTN